jgi:UDP-2-acetamido-3-amino-2,3-dideoxy-glucuronate N-acetyltransferase
VRDYALVYGNPARQQGWACQCGVKLQVQSGRATCCECGGRYELLEGRLQPIDA